MGIGPLLGLLVVVVLLAILWKRGRAREPAAAPPVRSEIDAWVEEALARELGKRTPLGADALLGALRGDPEPDAVSAIEGAVRSVKLKYERLAQRDTIEVRAEIAFEDGTSSTGARMFSEEKLPQVVRDEFVRSGTAFVFREWHFPWYGPDRGWA